MSSSYNSYDDYDTDSEEEIEYISKTTFKKMRLIDRARFFQHSISNGDSCDLMGDSYEINAVGDIVMKLSSIKENTSIFVAPSTRIDDYATIMYSLKLYNITEDELRLLVFHDPFLKYVSLRRALPLFQQHYRRTKIRFEAYKKIKQMKEHSQTNNFSMNNTESIPQLNEWDLMNGVLYSSADDDDEDFVSDYNDFALNKTLFTQYSMGENEDDLQFLDDDSDSDVEMFREFKRKIKSISPKEVDAIKNAGKNPLTMKIGSETFTIPPLPFRFLKHYDINYCKCRCSDCRTNSCSELSTVIHHSGVPIKWWDGTNSPVHDCSCRSTLTSSLSRLALLTYIDYCRSQNVFGSMLTIREKIKCATLAANPDYDPYNPHRLSHVYPPHTNFQMEPNANPNNTAIFLSSIGNRLVRNLGLSNSEVRQMLITTDAVGHRSRTIQMDRYNSNTFVLDMETLYDKVSEDLELVSDTVQDGCRPRFSEEDDDDVSTHKSSESSTYPTIHISLLPFLDPVSRQLYRSRWRVFDVAKAYNYEVFFVKRDDDAMAVFDTDSDSDSETYD